MNRKRIILERIAYFDWGVYGRLLLPELSLVTVERPWLGNKPWISCIPEGVYPVARTLFRRGSYETVEIMKVPERTDIKIHRGNWPRDVQGCVAVGLEFASSREAPLMITDSEEAFRLFQDATLSHTDAGIFVDEIVVRSYTPEPFRKLVT